MKNLNRYIFDDDAIQIKSVFKYSKIKNYMIYPEFDDKGRLHYHGLVSLSYSQQVRFYRHSQMKLKLLGFVDFKPLKTFKDRIKWILYCQKNFGMTKEILNINNPITRLFD